MRRGLKLIGSLAAAALAGAGLTLAAQRLFHRGAGPSPYRVQGDLYLTPGSDGVRVSDPARLEKADVRSIVDGDTIRVLWRGKEEKLRYYGVDTPEKDEACFEEATRRNGELCGREVRLAFDERSRDKYGRLLAYVFTPDGRSVDAALVSEGLGRAWTRDGRWRDGMEKLEQDARAERRGCLWAKDAGRGRGRRFRGDVSPGVVR